jgi:ABC-type uncharacterized transport system auxiliary subunit
MKVMQIARLVVAGMLVTSCSSILLSKSVPPDFYQLEYDPVAVSCPHAFDEGARVWTFTGSSPFDQTDMVVVKPSDRVVYSSSYQWVASPGTMIADSLFRDLSLGNLFPQVVSADSPTMVPLELTGHVFNFAWEQKESEAGAVLRVKLSLTRTGASPEVIYRKDYELRSRPFLEQDPAVFAKAMSSLVRQLSQEIQQDLCTRPGFLKGK